GKIIYIPNDLDYGKIIKMNTIEIRDEEIDVEEIMRKIRENIRKRRESGAYTYSEEMKDLINEPQENWILIISSKSSII
ncbi:MAG: hypothetical protein KAT65_08185, partial [Methanophagales archaeon]|nr:hypothetical protein [Methanophagales archaeon]